METKEVNTGKGGLLKYSGLEYDRGFIDLCKSKVITDKPLVKERITGTLAHYWPLLCEKFQLPLSTSDISRVLVRAEGWCKNVFGRGDKAGGYSPIWKGILVFPDSEFPDSEDDTSADNILAHEMTHAIVKCDLRAPIFITEGIAQAGESFVDIPDIQTEKDRLAYNNEWAFGMAIQLYCQGGFLNSEELINVNNVYCRSIVDEIPNVVLYPTPDKKTLLSSKYQRYDRDIKLFFRFLLEVYGPDKIKRLSEGFFLPLPFRKLDQVRINHAFKRTYGKEIDELSQEGASFWCGEKAGKRASEIVQRCKIYKKILQKKFENRQFQIYIGEVNIEPNKYQEFNGEYDVVAFKYWPEREDYFKRAIFINRNDGKIKLVKLPTGEEGREKMQVDNFNTLEEIPKDL